MDTQQYYNQSPEQKPHHTPGRKSRLKHMSKYIKAHQKPVIIASAAVLVMAVGLAIWFDLRPSQQQQSNFPLTIGSTTITQADVDRFKAGQEQFQKQNPDARPGDSGDAQATDSLILNAALRKEAFEKQRSLTSSEIKQLYDLPDTINPEEFYKEYQKQTGETSGDLAYYNAITRENLLLQRKLYDDLIGKRSLSYASVSFDAPYFRSQSNPQELQKLHDESMAQLKTEFLPLFKQGASKEEIGKKADVNYIGDPKLSNPDIFFQKAVTTVAYISNYNDSINSVEAAQQMPPDPSTDLNDVAQSFKDLNDIDYGITVPNLTNTADTINALQNVGDTTEVFASKTGAYMIVRLEGKQGGEYKNWNAFIDSYKPKTFKTSQATSSVRLGRTIRQLFAVPIAMISSQITPESASAQSVCSDHTVTMSIKMLDVETGDVVAGRVSLNQPGACGAGTRSSDSGDLTFLGNCYAPEPSVSYDVPSGYSFVGYQSSDWNPQNINQKGYWQSYIYVKRDTQRITGQSNLVPDDGQPSFGSNIRISSHAIASEGYYPFVNKSTTISGAWNQPKGRESYPVTASAPSSFISSKGTWELVGDSTKSRPATAANGWNADIQFRYRLGGGNNPTCTLSVDPTSLPAQGGNVTVTWSSTNSSEGSISPLIGALGSSGQPNSRFGGSQTTQVNGTTMFTGTWKSESGSEAQCSATVQAGGNPVVRPAEYKPYIRVYGNDVMVGSAFKDDFDDCSGYNYDAKVQATANQNTSGYNYGSSGQFAVFNYATGPGATPWEGGIEGFFSNNLNAKGAFGKHYSNDLVFGNHYSKAVSFGDLQDYYAYSERVTIGGDSGILHCNTNFFKEFQDNGSSIVGGGTLSSIDPAFNNPIPDGTRKAIVVDGDLYIDKNIEYASTTWPSVAAIPNISIIVRGNISISKDVNRLDGLFVAQPKCATATARGVQCFATQLRGGEIYSCGNENGPLPLSEVQSECNQQLTINGTVIARSARWYRSNGSVDCPNPSPLSCQQAPVNELSSSANIAEVINFSPELYIAPLNRQVTNNGPLQKYDSITSLPPVL